GTPPSFVARCERAEPPPRGNRRGGWRHGEGGEGPGGRPRGSASPRARAARFEGRERSPSAFARRPSGPPLLLLLVLRLEAGDHGRIGEGGRVADGAPLGDVAGEPAADRSPAP